MRLDPIDHTFYTDFGFQRLSRSEAILAYYLLRGSKSAIRLHSLLYEHHANQNSVIPKFNTLYTLIFNLDKKLLSIGAQINTKGLEYTLSQMSDDEFGKEVDRLEGDDDYHPEGSL